MSQTSNDPQTQIGLRGSVVRNPAQREEQRQEILLAAAKTFARKGYESATMDDIAKEMGVSKGILYYQFKSKQDLIVATRIEASGKAADRLAAICAQDLPVRDRMEAALRDLIADNFREIARHVILIAPTIGLDDAHAEQVREIERRYERLLVDLFAEGVAAGVFHDSDPHLTVFTLIRAAESPSFWYRPGGRLTEENVIDGIAEQLIRSISATH